jgi:peptidoglycan lytic transglycosylase
VRPGGPGILLQGQNVRVLRIRHVRETVPVEVPFTTLIQYSKDLDLGQRTIVEPGEPGKVLRTYEVTYRNGMEVRRVLLSEQSVTDPVRQVEIRGTRVAPAVPSSGAHSECGIASWYAGRTDGMVAAHKTLPFGTRVTVRDLDNGRTVTVVINDRGPYIAGRIIDLSNEAFAVLAPLGQGTARVCITW